MYLDKLLQELARKTGLADLKFSSEGVVSFLFNDTCTTSIEKSPDEQHIIIYGVIGKLPEIDRQNWLTTFLNANLLGFDTLGAAFGLDSDSQEIILSKTFSTHGLQFHTFYEELQQFMHVQQKWTDRLQGKE
jgi:hypothetical protein